MIINKKYLKQFSPIPLNFQLDEVLNYVPVAEKIWVKPILGEEFFDELQEQVDNNELSEENATLCVDILWQYLSYCTVLEALPILWANISQVGITLGKSDNADSVTLKDMTYIEQHIRRQVEVLKDELIDYLEEHWESFPLYHSSHCTCSKCQSDKGRLNKPNPFSQIYGLPRKCADIR